MADPRLVFSSSVESMMKTLGDPVPAEHHPALKKIGMDPLHVLPAYPLEQYQQLVELVGQVRFPKMPAAERDYALGAAFIERFTQNFMGRSIMGVTKLLGPRRSTHRLTRNFRSVNNYTESGATEISPTEMEVWCDPVMRPNYYRGVLESAGRIAHGPSYAVQLMSFEGERAVFRIRWTE